MREKLFFNTSKAVAQNITDLFDFIWPTASAIWNLRWQVQGFLTASPHSSDVELTNRFVHGSGIRGANLRRACVDTAWETQQEQFAKFLLIEFCAIYESWCEGVLLELSSSIHLSKQFQYPTSTTAQGKPQGVGHAISILNKSESSAIVSSIYPKLLISNKNSKLHLEELLVCYRYFKECRNSSAHKGGIASQLTEDAYTEYAKLSASSLGVKEIPEAFITTKSKPLKISLRGVVGFGDIILRLIATIDAELSRSSLAEECFKKRWKETITAKGNRYTLPSDIKKKEAMIRRLVKKLELPHPIFTIELENFLVKENLVGR